MSRLETCLDASMRWQHCTGVLQLCALLLASLAASVVENKPLSEQSVAGRNRIIIEAGTHPVLNPVDIYSSCCPESEQNITEVHINNISDVTPSRLPSSYAGYLPQRNINESIVALVKDNQIVLRNVSLLDTGHIYQIELEYQYNCHHNITNVCVPYCRDQCAFHHRHLESYICVCSETPLGRLLPDYTYLQRLTVDIRTYGLQLEIDCSDCSQNDTVSELTCKDNSMKLRCSSGLHDASDLWMYFSNHQTNRTAYCRPNQQYREFHRGWVLHRETPNYDCVLEIPLCDYEDAGDYQCKVFIPNKGSWVQSESRSISVQSTSPQNEWQIEGGSVGIGVGIAVTIVLVALIAGGIVVMVVKRRGQVVPADPEDQNGGVDEPREEEVRHLIPQDNGGASRYGSGAAAEVTGRSNIATKGSSKESSHEVYYETSEAFSN